MKKNAKKFNNFEKNSKNDFKFSEINAGAFTPNYQINYDLLRNKIINLKEFGIYSVLFNHGLCEVGETCFELSFPDLGRMVGLSQKPISRALSRLDSLGLIEVRVAANGEKTKFRIDLDALRKVNKGNPDRFGISRLGETTNLEDQTLVKTTNLKKQTLVETPNHLLEKILDISLLNQARFELNSEKSLRVQLLETDLERLAGEGYDLDACASFLAVNNVNRIGSFYAVISRQKNQLQSIHEKYQKQKNKNEVAGRDRAFNSRPPILDEIKFSEDNRYPDKGEPENAFKGNTGGEFNLDNEISEILNMLKFPKINNELQKNSSLGGE